MTANWADEKAREWLAQESNCHDEVPVTASAKVSLATLLREVGRDKQYEQWQQDQHVTAEELSKRMAKVRRVVEEEARKGGRGEAILLGERIISRLERLK